MGLYSTNFLGRLGVATEMRGLLSVMFHGAPGYHINTFVGIAPERTVVESPGHFCVEAANGVFWALVYGALGWVVDYARKRKVALQPPNREGRFASGASLAGSRPSFGTLAVTESIHTP